MTQFHWHVLNITEPVWGESIGQWWVPLQKGHWHGDLIFSLFASLNMLLDKQSDWLWSNTPLRTCDVTLVHSQTHRISFPVHDAACVHILLVSVGELVCLTKESRHLYAAAIPYRRPFGMSHSAPVTIGGYGHIMAGRGIETGIWIKNMMTSANGDIFRVTDPLWENSPVTGEFPTQRPVTQSLMFSLIRAWINGWVNNREPGDLRCHRAHYDVIVKNRGMLQWAEPTIV